MVALFIYVYLCKVLGDSSEAAIDSTVTSEEVTVSGFGVRANISIEDGEYSINGGEFVSETGVVKEGDRLVVRHTSASSHETEVVSVLTIGNMTISFKSMTIAAPLVSARNEEKIEDSTKKSAIGPWSAFIFLNLLLVRLFRRHRFVMS